MVAADYLRWLRRSERFTLSEIRRYLRSLTLLEGALILYLFTRRGSAGATAADAVIDVLRGLDGQLVAFRNDRSARGLRLWVRRSGWLERAVLPGHLEQLNRVELRHLLVADLTRRSGRHARLQVVRARYAPRHLHPRAEGA